MLREMLPVGDVALGPGRFWPEYVTCRRPQVAGTVLKRANSSQTGAAVIVETSASFALVLACVAVAARPHAQAWWLRPDWQNADDQWLSRDVGKDWGFDRGGGVDSVYLTSAAMPAMPAMSAMSAM